MTGVQTCALPISIPAVANNSTAGPVIVGANINVTSDGIISVAAPYSLPTASTGTLGGVKIDGTSIVIANGVISVNTASISGTTLPSNIVTTSITTVGTLTNLAVAGTTTFTGIASHAADITWSNNQPIVTDIFDLDEIVPTGFDNRFGLYYNNQPYTGVTSPWQLQVIIDGQIQPAWDNNYDLVWFSSFLGSQRGYTIDNNTIVFASIPPSQSKILVRTVGTNYRTHTPKLYPFKAADILLGL